MQDDIALLTIAGAFAQGETIINGVRTLGGPQGNRMTAIAAGLKANKVTMSLSDDSLILAGDGKVAGGGRVDSQGDPAIAMSFAVMGLATRHKVTIKGAEAIAESFPDFVANMTAAGGRFPPTKGPKT